MEDLSLALDKALSEGTDIATAQQLAAPCPAFIMPLVALLRHPTEPLDDYTTRALVERVALNMACPGNLRRLLDPEGTGKYDNFYPATARRETPATNDAIDTFLNTYGNIDPAEEELLNRMIFNPVPDYAASLERDTPTPTEPRDQQDILLDAFIAGTKPTAVKPVAEKTEKGTPKPDKPSPRQAPQGSLLSESLAKIFIKQGHYRRAYEIIESLSLNYPEKSIYFADQLRFLGKLIANQEAIQRNKNNTK